MKTTSTTRRTVNLYWSYAWRYPKYVLGILLFVPITVLVNTYLPALIVANVLTRLSGGDFVPDKVWESFGVPLLAYATVTLLGTITWRIVDAFVWRLEANVQRDLAQQVYRHLLSQSANFHANSFGGSLVSQTNKLLGSYVRLADTTIFSVLPLLWGLIFTAVILLKRAPLFVVIFVVFSLVYMAVSLVITKKGRLKSAEHAEAESVQTGYLADSVTNVMAIKSFAGTKYEERQFAKVTTRTHDQLRSLGRVMQIQMTYFSGLSTVIQILALLMAVVSVVIFKSNIGTVFLVLNYTGIISEQLFTFSNNVLRNYNRSFGDASEMTNTLQFQPEIQDVEKPQKVRINNGAIQVSDVTFNHDGANDALFNGLSLDIKAGEKIGLVGHSGSGKTTFTRLLLRFSDIDSGKILIDGQDISKITQDDLHRKIAYVPQEPIMFHRSLYENIRYGEFKASEAEVLKAAKIAHAHDFIKDLPDGYETLVGERGVKLSGGQRQRIAIARAMIKNAPILVLDEATSALDSESEVLIQDALWKLMEGRTAIVIAHRLSTIQKMDRIIVLDNGEISEQGTHQELLKSKGIYAKLWAHQSGGFLED